MALESEIDHLNLSELETSPAETISESNDGLYLYSSVTEFDGIAVYEKRVPRKIGGSVFDPTNLEPFGSPSMDAAIELADGDSNTHVAVGDANGRYSFDSYLSIPDGTYSARVMAPGYEPKDLPAFTFTGDDINLGRTFMRRHEMNSKLVGTVTRSDSGLAVPGVRVEVQGGGFATDHTYTSANGNYEFVFADTKGTNDAALSIAENDFAPYDTTATLLQDAETRVDIILDPIATTGAGGLSGTVNGPDSAVPFPQLTFTGPMRFTLSGDAMGHYTATGLTPGIYIVRVSAVGYAGRSHYVNVAAEKSYTRDFALATGDFSDPSEDGVINSIDIQSVINAVLEGANAGSTGNVNGDDQVNAVDIQMIINAVLLGS